MAIFYLDPENGNDANDGSSWALAWKTITGGATTVRIAPGDTIRIKKSPDPVSLGVNATWTDNSNQITLASALTKTIDQCESAWTPSENVTCNIGSSGKKEGTYYASFVIASAFTTGKAAYKNLGSSLNLSSYDSITFWIFTSVVLAASCLRIDLCSDTEGETVVDSFTLPALSRGNKWHPILVARDGGGSLGNSIQSIRLYFLSDPGTPTIRIDNIEACNDFSLQSLIGKNTSGESWGSIMSIVETTITLDGKYGGTSETVTTYRRETLKTTPGTNDGVVNDSGTISLPITFSGGWNSSTTEQDGETWFDGTTQEAYGIYASSKNFINFEKISGVRFNHAIYLYSVAGMSVLDAHAVGNYGVGFNFSLANPVYYFDLENIFSIFSASSYGIAFAGVYYVQATGKNIIVIGNYNEGIDVGNCIFLILENVKCFSNGAFGIDLQGGVEINTIHTKGNPIGMRLYQPGRPVHMYNTKFEEVTKITTSNFPNNLFDYYSIQKYEQVEGDNRRYYQFGEIRTNTSEARGGSGVCMQMIPNNAIGKLRAQIGSIPAEDSVQRTVTVYMKKSADYNGNNPRIGLWHNCKLVAGMNACSVTTSYQQFSINYTPTEDGILELVIDCDGTAGYIYVDDIGF